MKRTYRVILIISLVLCSFLTGFTYRDFGIGGLGGARSAVSLLPDKLTSATAAALGRNASLSPVETYCDTYAYLDSNYYGSKPKPKELTYAAIRGMLTSLGDRYTRFLDPEEYKTLEQENRGDFEGIGAELDTKDGRVFIRKPIKNSPAILAGLQKGDVILKVDDQPILGLDILEVVKHIRGPRGTKVKLTLLREGVPEPFDVQIVRDVIPITIVEARMEDETSKIGVIALRQFNEKSDWQFNEALSELESQGLRGLILDLRNNPGGLLNAAVEIGSRFIPKGNIAIIQSRGGQRNVLPVERSKHNHAMHPLVVLIDERTASASEIVAGAIRDSKVGTLVGTDTFGKGLVQTILRLDDGSALSITTAKYFTPAGRDVNKEKIHPDIVVEPTDEDIKADKDVQLERAVQFLRERLGVHQASSPDEARDKG